MKYRHTLRQTQNLGGLWDFAFLETGSLDDFTPDAFTPDDRVLVPGAFDVLQKYAGKRGLGVYRTTICVPEGMRGVLLFEAVSMGSRVWVDGKMLHANGCGYAPFAVELPDGPEKRELVVVTDNRFDFEARPMHDTYFDFYQYGGIIRVVTLLLLPEGKPCVKTLHLTPDEKDYAKGVVHLDLALCCADAFKPQLRLSICGQPVEDALPDFDAEGHLRCTLTVKDPKVWSPDAPNLHCCRVELLDEDGEAYDDAGTRFGLRRIEARDGKLFLNGEELELRGYNRHEWCPMTGPSTPVAQMYEDIRLMREMGCNFVRGSHYHQDQQFLDLCDEMGMLVWEENLGWGQREKTFKHPAFAGEHLTALKSMVEISFNHPSIIMWGFLNEADSHKDYARAVFEESAKTLKAMDPSRLVTYATMFPEEDIMYDLVDLISVNSYPGWYGCENVKDPLSLIAPRFEEILKSIDERGFADKPVIISETGAEALYGWREPHNDFFSEAYQAKYLAEACRAVFAHSRISGVALWHFSDVRTYGGGHSLMRPRTYNNKGTFDEYRRPKQAHEAVSEAFRGR